MSHTQTAPLCLFVYKRVDSLQETIASLLQNDLAAYTSLHVFSDAAATAKDEASVNEVRAFIKGIRGFKAVSTYLSETNKGLAKSIIEGVSLVIEKEGAVIVLEDDLAVSSNFLDYMNGALAFYEAYSSIFSISGYTSPVHAEQGRDVYFSGRGSSWGWATWKDRWAKVDWEVSDFEDFLSDTFSQKEFNKMGSDLTHMLKKQQRGIINSWAIRWVYQQFKNQQLTVYPVVSKVINNGFNESASNTLKNNLTRFATRLDLSGKRHFDFDGIPKMEPHLIRQFIKPYTLTTRARYKIKALLNF